MDAMIVITLSQQFYAYACVDSQIWHLPRLTSLTGRVDQLDRSSLYSPSRFRVLIKSPFVNLFLKGYVFPGL